MKGAAAGMNMKAMYIAMAMPADADMTTVISIITTTRAAVLKNTTTNTKKNVVVGMIISTGITTMFRGIRRTANAKFATRTKNTATCAAKVWKTVPAKCLMPTA